MEAFDALKNRRSVREFTDKPVAAGDLEKIADAGRLAATARNVQPCEFVVVANRETLKKLGGICVNGPFLARAAAAIVVVGGDVKYYLEDGCAATQNILVAATALGIGSCWVAGDKKDYAGEVLKLVGAPAGFKLVSVVALGYAANTPSVPKRALKEVLHRETY